MSDADAPTAHRLAESLRHHAGAPWELFGERIRRFELHLNGDRLETARGPIELEGYGLRLLRPHQGKFGVGHFASTDLSEHGLRFALEQAEAAGRHSSFPASSVELPGAGPDGGPVELVDRHLWENPVSSLEEFTHTLVEAARQPPDVVPSFGSVRATLCETSIANSNGLRRQYRHTIVELEVAVKADGGPEGPPPGEYWVNQRMRRLPGEPSIREAAVHWAKVARDVRGAAAPTGGAGPVVLPPSVLADIVPAILGFRLAGASRLRKMMPEEGSTVARESVSVFDDGRLPLGLGSSPCDDEGTPQRRRAVIERGVFRGGLYDTLHAAAFQVAATGNARRDSTLFQPWFHFDRSPVALQTNLVIPPGDGGTEAELAESVGEGIWVDQLGYAFPDPISAAFGGEIRAGYRIRHGRIAEPLRGGTVGGLVLAGSGQTSLLGSVRAIGARAELTGYLSCPALVVEGLEVAGPA